MSDSTPPPPPGWYADPVMPGTQRYWDGSAWSEHVAPAGSAAASTSGPASSGMGPWAIALGVLIAAGVIWLIYSVATANDDLDCAVKNTEQSQACD